MAFEDLTPNLTVVANIDKTEVKFYSYGIFTVPILPLLLLAIHLALLQIPQIYLLVWIIVVVRLILKSGPVEDIESSNILSRIIYVLAELSFGVRTSKKNTHQFRLEWFLLFGGPVLGFILFFVYASTIFIFPALIIIVKRKWFLRNAFKFALLPRSEYFVEDLAHLLDEKDDLKLQKRRKEQEEELQYQEQMEYLHFYKPKLGTRVFSYFFLFITPLIFVLIFSIFLGLVLDSGVQKRITETAGIMLVWGYIGIVPYLVLSMLRNKRITKFASSTFAESIVSTLTSTSISYLPMFNGEYFFEQNSRVVDMSDTFGFFEIFKSGRWYSIILLPLAAISFIFTRILSRAEDRRIDPDTPITTERFLDAFSNQVLVEQTGALIFYLLILLPILISIVLPLLWVLKDSEIKRTTWEQDEGGGTRGEISSVEDLGSTLNRVFGLFLGLSTITGLSSITRRLVSEDVATTDVYIITFIMILLGALLVLPGTLFMAYRYLSLGDHASGVNYLRYNLSQSEDIGVGTVVKGYDTILTLDPPVSPYVRAQIGLDQENS